MRYALYINGCFEVSASDTGILTSLFEAIKDETAQDTDGQIYALVPVKHWYLVVEDGSDVSVTIHETEEDARMELNNLLDQWWPSDKIPPKDREEKIRQYFEDNDADFTVHIISGDLSSKN